MSPSREGVVTGRSLKPEMAIVWRCAGRRRPLCTFLENKIMRGSVREPVQDAEDRKEASSCAGDEGRATKNPVWICCCPRTGKDWGGFTSGQCWMEMEWNTNKKKYRVMLMSLQDNAKSVLDGWHPPPTEKGFVYSGVELYSSDSTYLK